MASCLVHQLLLRLHRIPSSRMLSRSSGTDFRGMVIGKAVAAIEQDEYPSPKIGRSCWIPSKILPCPLQYFEASTTVNVHICKQ